MKRILTIGILVACFTGCDGVDRLIGRKDFNPGHKAVNFYTVSCCRDGDAYPTSVPNHHRAFCDAVREANFKDELYNGDSYLAMSVDCGNGHHDFGDEFYD